MELYTHFGKQPDVFKHLILCEVLQNEKPHTYVETNSACAVYHISRTPEQQYGIYHFLDRAHNEIKLKVSNYYCLENLIMKKGCYLGSPGLAMQTLGVKTNEYLFFDIENSSLENVKLFAKDKKLYEQIKTFNCDSIEEVMNLLPTFPISTFLHIDPYRIDEKGPNGYTYLDVLIKATQLGLKCLLWYGFMTINEKQEINQYIADSFEKEGVKRYTCVELIMNSIKQDTIKCNPGILGSGILATNLSQKSTTAIFDYSKWLVEVYRNTLYKNYDGSLYRDIIR